MSTCSWIQKNHVLSGYQDPLNVHLNAFAVGYIFLTWFYYFVCFMMCLSYGKIFSSRRKLLKGMASTEINTKKNNRKRWHR